MNSIAIFGASGLSREVADICRAIGYSTIVFLDRQARAATVDDRYSVLSEVDAPALSAAGYHFGIGIGAGQARRAVAERFPDLHYPNLIHPLASFGHLQLERFGAQRGNVIAAGARFTTDITVGSFGVFNLNCTVGHDCAISDYVTVAPNASISGNVALETGVSIGTGAVTVQGQGPEQKLHVGSWAVVGAGAVVTRTVPANAVVKGNPAR